MVFLLLSPHRVLVHGQNRTPRLYSSGTRSRNRLRARWHLCWLHRLVKGMGLVQARTYSDRREPHFSYRPQSCAAFRHWFSPSSCMKDEARGLSRMSSNKTKHYQLHNRGVKYCTSCKEMCSEVFPIRTYKFIR